MGPDAEAASEAEIFTPDEVEKLLNAARNQARTPVSGPAKEIVAIYKGQKVRVVADDPAVDESVITDHEGFLIIDSNELSERSDDEDDDAEPALADRTPVEDGGAREAFIKAMQAELVAYGLWDSDETAIRAIPEIAADVLAALAHPLLGGNLGSDPEDLSRSASGEREGAPITSDEGGE